VALVHRIKILLDYSLTCSKSTKKNHLTLIEVTFLFLRCYSLSV